MKNIIMLLSALMAVLSCARYELNVDFTVPTELDAPEAIKINVASTEQVVLSWSGGGAADGGTVLYNVLFDKESGDFTSPIAEIKSDYGALETLTLTHATINNIARNAGIMPEETGNIKWTVTASKGGVVKQADVVSFISVTRGEGIDNIPENLFLVGTGAGVDAEGRTFRNMSEGVFRIYTTLEDGKISFRSSDKNDAFNFYIDDESGKLKEGTGETTVSATASDELVRITVDFNSLTMTVEHLLKEVYYVLGINGDTYVTLNYQGKGQFTYTGLVPYVRDQWGPGAHEERYYFRVSIDGNVYYWGRGEGISAEQPSDNESIMFYQLHEYNDFNQMWNFAWKVKWDFLDKNTTVTIDTNADNMMVHSFKLSE